MTTTASTDINHVRSSAFSTLVSMFTEPSRAFAALEKRSMVLLPLLLATLGSALLLLWYYQSVDFAWLQEKLLAGKDMEPAQLEAAKKFMGKSTLIGMSLASTFIGIPVFYALIAVYFLIVAKVSNLTIGFGQWFAFATWSAVPSLLSIPLGVIQILLTQQGQLAPNQLNPLSLNQLFFHIDMNLPWAGLLDNITVTSIWVMVLMVIGFQTWSKKSRATSIAVVVTPCLIIYGVMAVINLMHKAS
ncbi:YIP1 family protein [Solimicrobium silvestre]|uniref:Yip1 domain n=1 Tax=Solimicrobium silvestre TaxID=2099400 RepID=A0A2S9H3B4_9BURK|nr:YIP1 family protein [Solimicrobium silvestre]PRC94469.1 Yip1 domain [Solimicrobium silvestre]